MKICPSVTEKPQLEISLPTAGTHFSGRAGNFLRAAAPFNPAASLFVKRQNLGVEASGNSKAALGDLTPLHTPCTAQQSANAFTRTKNQTAKSAVFPKTPRNRDAYRIPFGTIFTLLASRRSGWRRGSPRLNERTGRRVPAKFLGG